MDKDFVNHCEKILEKMLEVETRQQSINRQLRDMILQITKHLDLKLTDLQDGLLSPGKN